MFLTTWNAFPKLDRLIDGAPFDARGVFDVQSTDDRVVLSCDLPGMKPEDVELTLENGVLTIRGERKYAHERVRGYGKIARSITLPEGVDIDRVTAQLSDGVLTIEIPKLPKAQPKKIAIGVGGRARAKQLDSNEKG